MPRPWLRLAACLAVVVLVGGVVALQHHRHSRATTAKVGDAAYQAPDGVDHVEVSGRTFRLSRFARAGGTIVQAVAADTKGLPDGTVSIVRTRPSARGGDVQLSWSGSAGGPLRVRFVRAGHQVVLTGQPATEAVRRAMSTLAGR
jgi:hypothetical protein